ncbi:hypothetical protein KY321_01310 [Candidatus Woesearchaeota archaeon]|nr:hypothetical protein [Candidatus Woesearchaeota archaeon]
MNNLEQQLYKNMEANPRPEQKLDWSDMVEDNPKYIGEEIVKYTKKIVTNTVLTGIIGLSFFGWSRAVMGSLIWAQDNNYSASEFVGQALEDYKGLKQTIDNFTLEDMNKYHNKRMKRLREEGILYE